MKRKDEKMKVLHVLFQIHETSGPYNEHCLPMARERDISVCTFFRSNIVPSKEIKLFEGDDTIMGFIRTIKTALKSKDYDVVHVHAPHLAIFLIAVNLLHWRSMRRTVYTIQNSYQNYKFRNRMMLFPIFIFFRKLIPCSKASLESYPKFLKWLGRGKFHVAQNGVDVDRIDRVIASVGEKKQNGHFTIVSVGRIIKIKNPVSLLKAFQQSNNQDGRLVFVGEGDLRPALTKEIEKLGLEEQVKLTGLVGRDEVFSHVSRADLFVSTSYGEGLPVAVMETMACGCPVILSDIPPHREIAEGADFIPLIDPNDISGFERQIRRFRQMPDTERKEIGEKCRMIIKSRFNLGIMHKRHKDVYTQLS